MFPQPKKYGQAIVGLIFLVYAVNNPEKAAGLINQLIEAGTRFVGALS